MYETEHKKLLIDLFSENKEQVFSTTELIEQLRTKMNKATIYRQLQTLEKENVVRKTYSDTLKVYEYQYAINCDQHLHLKCINCGKVVHLSCKEANQFISHIFQQHGFSIDQYSSTILGRCKECFSC